MVSRQKLGYDSETKPMRSRIVTMLAIVAVALMGGACVAQDEKEVLPPVVLAMTPDMPPAYDDGQEQIYQVSREVRLPYRRPNDTERPRGDLDPYPRRPFHIVTDTRVAVRFTLSNLDDKQHQVELLFDPWNEFVRYVPGVQQVEEDEVLPNFSGIQRTFLLPPKGRIEGILTPDDIIEMATDLTIAMALEKRPPDAMGQFGGAALYNRTFNIQNRTSEPDPVLQPWLPSAKSNVAAIIGFDVGLRTPEPSKIAVELVIDIEDLHGERVVMEGEEGQRTGRPGDALTPPAAAAP
jgi:hypothetical protein